MSRSLLAGLLALCVGACATGEATELEPGDAGDPDDATTLTRTLERGTRVNATTEERLSSRRAGDVFRATLASDVSDSRGNVIIASGTTILLSIQRVAADTARLRPDGPLSLLVTSASLSGVSYSLYGTLDTPTGDRDARNAVVVAAGSPIVITLTRALNYER